MSQEEVHRAHRVVGLQVVHAVEDQDDRLGQSLDRRDERREERRVRFASRRCQLVSAPGAGDLERAEDRGPQQIGIVVLRVQ
jgi:hypothetical protein